MLSNRVPLSKPCANNQVPKVGPIASPKAAAALKIEDLKKTRWKFPIEIEGSFSKEEVDDL